MISDNCNVVIIRLVVERFTPGNQLTFALPGDAQSAIALTALLLETARRQCLN